MKKMKKWALITTGALIAASVAVSAQAGLTNGGFEDGNFTGWTLITPSGATSTVVTNSVVGGQTAFEGTKFAQLKTDGANAVNSISQSFLIGASGGFVKGAVSWWDQEEASTQPAFFNDTFKVEIFDTTCTPCLVATPFFFQHADNTGSGIAFFDWQQWQVGLGAGSYSVQYSIQNVGDSIVDSYLFADAVMVPEPATLLLLGAGLAVLGLSRRCRRWVA